MFTRDQIRKAIVTHGAWKIRLKKAIDSGHSAFEVHHVQMDDRCEFGNWLYHLPAGTRREIGWKEVQAAHAQFHQEAARILTLALQGQKQEAAALLRAGSTYGRLSRTLVALLRQWERASR